MIEVRQCEQYPISNELWFPCKHVTITKPSVYMEYGEQDCKHNAIVKIE